jgi:hypothetical protein
MFVGQISNNGILIAITITACNAINVKEIDV